ncbi:MAG: SDR family NAD(P)-dependent oxidoreductase [Bacteroidales bacterium]|nr:SDR family NAD(P)-dependent oxidoreductase [Bacteroidales bacterium]
MKTAIIIGATSGIGKELATRLASDGWVVGAAGRRADRLEELASQFPEGTILTQAIDITSSDATAALDTLLARTGSPDLFLHVSGIGKQNPDLDEKIETNTMETNCTGMVRMVIHFINYVKACGEYSSSRKVHIGVISSVAGTAGIGNAPAYSASKRMQQTYISALVQLSRMKHLPVTFSDIRPGFVATDLLNPNKKYPMTISVDKAARCILNGLNRRKRIICFDWRYRILVFFWKLIPRCIWERLTFVKN